MASVSPEKLPATAYAPVTWTIFGKVSTSDGTHPSALREIALDVDKGVRINARGYPVCKSGQRDLRTPRKAMKVCGHAVLGKGTAHIEVAFPEQKPILVTSPITVFNRGEKGGKVKLLIHVFITVPAPAALVTQVTITKRGAGLNAVARVPAIAGGKGSLLDFKFEVGKTYSYKGKKYGYFEAKCPDGVFKANVKKLLFKNEAKVPGVQAQTEMKGSLAVPCTPKG